MLKTVIECDREAGPSDAKISSFKPQPRPPPARSSGQGSGQGSATLPSVSEEPGGGGEAEEEGDPAGGPAGDAAEDSLFYATRRMVDWVYTVRCIAFVFFANT